MVRSRLEIAVYTRLSSVPGSLLQRAIVNKTRKGTRMTKDNTKRRRGAVKEQVPYRVTDSTTGRSMDVDLSHANRRQLVSRAVTRYIEATPGMTRATFAAKAGGDVTVNLLHALARGEGKLTVERYVAIRNVLPYSDAIVLTEDEARKIAQGNNVIQAFPMASIATSEADETINWRQMLAALIESGCLTPGQANTRYVATLRGESVMPERDLVLRTISQLADGDLTLDHAWRQPPLKRFAELITLADGLYIQDILERAQKSQPA